MLRFSLRFAMWIAPVALLATGDLFAQNGVPRVVVPTGSRPVYQTRPVAPQPTSTAAYPWRTHVTSTIFWIGEQPTQNNPTPNCKSSWDTAWAINFGGYDNPDPASRIANHSTGEFRPKNFVPKLNPFYVALPYNDVLNYKTHKAEASRVIPWFSKFRPLPGKTVCKGRWVQIFFEKRSCFAQWEDCGPWTTDDFEYVFGNKPPKTTQNGAAGIDLSPSIRDYLGLKSGQKVHWRFVEPGQVPYGPWKKYGNDPGAVANVNGNDPSAAADQRYMENLRKMRDEQFLKKPLRELQN